MSDVTVRRVKKVMHVAGCQKLRTCSCPFEYGEGWLYDIRFTWPSGTPFRERRKVPLSGLTEKKACAWATERRNAILAAGETKLAQQKEEPKTEPAPTLREFGPLYINDYCKANRNKPRTIEEKEHILEYHLYPRFGGRRLDEIRLAEVQRLKGDLEDLSPSRVNNVLNVLSTLLTFAVDLGVLKTQPVIIELLTIAPVEVEFYEPDIYEKIVAAAKEIDVRAYLMVLLGGEAGLRRGEIVALEQNDIDFARGFIHVRRSESKGYLTAPKNGRSRKVDMTARLAAALRGNRHLRDKRVLWRDPDYRWDKPHLEAGVTDRTLQNWMERVQRRAGVEVTGNLHILRHTFCSRLAMAGVPTKVIKELAGHASIITTERYMHLAPGSTSDAIHRLESASGFGRILADASAATETTEASRH